MSTIGEQLRSAAIGALNTTRPAGVPQISRLSAKNLIPAKLPDGVLVPGPMRAVRATNRGSALTQVEETWLIWWRSAGDGVGNGPDVVIDPMLAWAIKTLERNTFGGLAIDIELAGIKDWEFAPVDRFFGQAQQQFEVRYTHRVGNAELKD